MKTILFILICCLFTGHSLLSQGDASKDKKWTESEEKQLEKAELFFSEKDYRLALPIYEKLIQNHPNDIKLKYLFGVCALTRPGMQKTSLSYLQEVYAKNKKASDIQFFLAKANFLNENFDEALKYINEYSTLNKKLAGSEQKEVLDFINYCNNAKSLSANPVNVKITNMGAVINSAAAESAPCLTDDESVIVFTYRGENSVGGLQNAFNQPDKNGLYYEDVFVSKKDKGSWQKPMGATNINTKNNEAVLFLSNDGQKLFVSVDSQQDDGDIHMCTLDSNEWSLPTKLTGDVNTPAWEDNSSLSPDGKTLFFASNRSDGFGGKDIYKATLLPNGTWGNVKNLGDKINTPLDDDAPFIHYDGRLLLFSSKGHNSMGGYDIFKTYFNSKDSTWSTPENIGYPINTPADDNHYVLSPSGETGYYALGKPDGYGDLDIYTVQPGITGMMPVVAVVKGTVSMDGAPVQAEVIVETLSNNEVFHAIRSNDLTGNYCISLPVGNDYKITWKLNGFDPKTEMLLAANVQEYLLKIADINFTTKKDTAIVSSDSLNAHKAIEDRVIEGLVYKIQVSSGSINRKLKKKLLKDFGEIEEIKIKDVPKFVLRENYDTFNQVHAKLERVRAYAKDAFVIGIYKGERHHLYELREKGILPIKDKK